MTTVEPRTQLERPSCPTCSWTPRCAPTSSRPTSSGAPPPRRTRSRARSPRTAATPSIWDTFAATPGRVRDGDTGDVACDHYHRYADDVALMRELGLGGLPVLDLLAAAVPRAGRRAQPARRRRSTTGWSTSCSRPGIDALGDALPLGPAAVPRGRRRLAGPRHRGAGSPSSPTAVGGLLGDRVGHFITLNEPWCSAFLGYGSGHHAPGRGRPRRPPSRPATTCCSATGWPSRRCARAAPTPEVGITLNLYPVDAGRRLAGGGRPGAPDRRPAQPLVPRPGAARRATPPTSGGPRPAAPGRPGPRRRPRDDRRAARLPRRQLLHAPRGPRPRRTRAPTSAEFGHRGLPRGRQRLGGRPGRADRGAGPGGPRLHRRCRSTSPRTARPGSTRSAADGSVHDPDRLAYLAAHLAACARAREAGADVAGYFAWSLLDNFEWAEGYAMRFGLVHVDFATQRRTVKASGAWYARFVARRPRRHTDAMTRQPRTPPDPRGGGRGAPGSAGARRRGSINGSAQVSERAPPGRRGRDRRARLRAQPGRPHAGHPAHRRGRAGHRRVRGAGLRRAVLRRRGPRHRRRAQPTPGCQLVLLLAHAGAPQRAPRRLPDPPARRRRAAAVAARRRHAARADPGARRCPWSSAAAPPSDQQGAYVDADNVAGRPARRRPPRRTAAAARIATIAGPADMVVGPRPATTGYLAGLAAAGLPSRRRRSSSRGDFSQDSGEAAMRVLLARRPDLDAVFCANDLMAAGALRVLREAGLDVPERRRRSSASTTRRWPCRRTRR